jgi:hypothetical protein
VQAAAIIVIVEALPEKSSVIENAAPTARNMKARGKRKAQRSASPLGYRIRPLQP